MNNIERRDKNLAYIADEDVIEEIIQDIFRSSEENNSINIKQLKSNIATTPSNEFSAEQLPDLCFQLGIGLGTKEEAMKNKFMFISNMLFGLNKKQTLELITKIKENLDIEI